jgi:hypothetical protein
MMAEEIEINWEQLNAYKDVCVRLQKKIQEDHQCATGSSLHREDLMMAGIVCMLTKAYKTKKIKSK